MTPETLATLHARCFSVPLPWNAASFASLLDSPHVFLHHDPEGRAFVLGRVIAGEAELLTIATAPEARRLGLGRAMMAAFEGESRARGAETAFLEVAENNAPARSLYAACGFAEAGRRRGYYRTDGGMSVDAMILCKSFA